MCEIFVSRYYTSAIKSRVGELTMVGKTVSVINLKGGVGKSTIAMILSEFLVFDHKMRVLGACLSNSPKRE